MKNRIDEIHITKEGYQIRIISYNNSADCSVIFNDGTIIESVQYFSIKKGSIKNPNHKSVFGIGFFGTGKYKCSVNKIRTKSYTSWQNMLQRCYDKNYQKTNQTYVNSYVIVEWHNYQNFAKWFEENYIEDFDLDKDILFKGNKIYSPETCCFVPRKINTLLIKCNKTRGLYPIGVNRMGKKFQSIIRSHSVLKHLGLFDTPEEAFKVYKEEKERDIKKIAISYYNDKLISEKVYRALISYKVEITD